jgi:hypothetical protein
MTLPYIFGCRGGLVVAAVNRNSGNVRKATGGHLLSIWSQVAGVHPYTELFTPRGQNPGHRSQQLRRDREAQATNHRPPTLDTHGFMCISSLVGSGRMYE